MEENQNNSSMKPNPGEPISTMPIQTPSHPVWKKIFIIFSIALGLFQILTSPLFLYTISEFRNATGIGSVNIMFFYSACIVFGVIVAIGVFNLVNGIKLIKNRTSLRKILVFSLSSILIQLLLLGLIIFLSVFKPISEVLKGPPFLFQQTCEVKMKTVCIKNTSGWIPKTTPSPDLYTGDNYSTTANWKTYTSGEISFKYPQGWKVSSSSSYFRLEITPNSYSGNGSSVIFLTYYDNPNNLSLKAFDDANTGASGNSPGLYSPSNKQMALSDGTVVYFSENVACEPTACDSYIIPYKNKIYTVRSGKPQVIPNQKQILDQILSTFKFTETIDTSTWKTYKGNKFTFAYPSEFENKNCPRSFEPTMLCTVAQDESVEPILYYIYLSDIKSLPSSYRYEEGMISGYSTYKTTDEPSRSGAITVFIKQNENSFVSISFTPYDQEQPFPNQQKFENLFDQILSTFKFTN